jgi:shikimate dehydrogenase
MSSRPPRAFVAGWPVSHSRSPLIHRHWLDRYGIAGDYVRQAVPSESAASFFQTLAESGFVGGNVTLPHKQTAFEQCHQRTAVALRLRAVNTLWLEGDRLHGDNTDVHGFAANLDERAPEWRLGTSAVVLGAGGAARAVVQAILDAGFASVTVLNRTSPRAEELARHFGPLVHGGGLEDCSSVLASADLVVNTASAGLGGEGGIHIDWEQARPGAIVTDIVYVPLETAFLAAARRRGLKTVDGLGMLLHQAVPGFQRWFGVLPEVDEELRQIVLKDLGGQ